MPDRMTENQKELLHESTTARAIGGVFISPCCFW